MGARAPPPMPVRACSWTPRRVHCRKVPNSSKRICLRMFVQQAEMTQFMTLLTRAAYKVGLIPEPVPVESLPAVTENMFHIADADGGGDVDAAEFIGWAKSHVLGKKLLKAFRSKKKRAHALVRRVAPLPAPRSLTPHAPPCMRRSPQRSYLPTAQPEARCCARSSRPAQCPR